MNKSMISGSMPKWRRNFNRFASGFMCLWFAGLGFIAVGTSIRASHGPGKAGLIVSLLFLAMLAFGISAQLWFQRRIIVDFNYDGSTLQFRTLGFREPRLRPVSDLEAIREWRGKGGSLGYRLLFQGGQKLYLGFEVTNSIELANALRGATGERL